MQAVLPLIHDFRPTVPALCRQENKSATNQAPRHPPQPLQKAAESLSGKRSTDDGRVVRGTSKPAQDGAGGRFYLNVTGFPFPLGPLFARQTVRCEVHTLLRFRVVLQAKLPSKTYISTSCPDCSCAAPSLASAAVYACAVHALSQTYLLQASASPTLPIYLLIYLFIYLFIHLFIYYLQVVHYCSPAAQ